MHCIPDTCGLVSEHKVAHIPNTCDHFLPVVPCKPMPLVTLQLASACEALVGSVHFEGRICEELLRLSSDGVLRCFTPYDCEKPRISIQAAEILQVQELPGQFLGRFLLWQAAGLDSENACCAARIDRAKVSTFLKVFVFCCADSEERETWISNLQRLMASEQNTDETRLPLEQSPREVATPKTPATWRRGQTKAVTHPWQPQ